MPMTRRVNLRCVGLAVLIFTNLWTGVVVPARAQTPIEIRLHQRSVTFALETYGENSRQHARALEELASAYGNAGMAEQAADTISKMRSVWTKTRDANSAAVAPNERRLAGQ